MGRRPAVCTVIVCGRSLPHVNAHAGETLFWSAQVRVVTMDYTALPTPVKTHFFLSIYSAQR